MHATASSVKLRILTIADIPPDPNAGAAGTILFTNAALRELGHHVDEMWQDHLGKRRIGHGNLHALLEQPRAYRRAINRHVGRGSYDAVLAHQPQSYLAAKAFHRSQNPGVFVTVSQGVENRIAPILRDWHRRLGVPRSRFPRSLMTPLLERLLSYEWPQAVRWSDGVIVQHRQDCEFLQDQMRADPRRVHIWESGLPESYFTTATRSISKEHVRNLLYVGQLAFYKGPQLLARIADLVLTRNTECKMTIVCHPRDHDAGRRLFHPRLSKRITFLPWMPQEDLIRVFDQNGVFLFPTIAEGFGRVGLEAMSRALCVVASDCCGMRDYIEDQSNGFLCPVGAVDNFAAVVERLLHDSALAGRVSIAAERAARRFTWTATAERLAEYLIGLKHARMR